VTLEAWVKPTALSGWRTVVLKELTGTGLCYALYAHDNEPHPAGYIRTGLQVLPTNRPTDGRRAQPHSPPKGSSNCSRGSAERDHVSDRLVSSGGSRFAPVLERHGQLVYLR
jgi:hypothetical protein